jgi:hypothetical protein
MPGQIVARLAPAPDELVVDRRFPDAFDAAGLERVLARPGVGIIPGHRRADRAVRAFDAARRARVRLRRDARSDAHTTDDLTVWGAPPPAAVIGHMNLMWGQQRAPGRTCGVLESQNLDFAQPAG